MRKNKTFLWLLFVLCCCFTSALGQRLNDDEIVEIQNILELIAETNEDIVNNDTYFEQLTDLYSNKIRILKADYDDMSVFAELGLLSEIQVNSFFEYQKKVGKILNQYELQAIPYWDLAAIKRVLPFIKIGGDITDINVPTKELLFGGQHVLFFRGIRTLEQQKGYTPDTTYNDETGEIEEIKQRYLGDPNRVYMRYRYKYGRKLSYGLTAEKDPGEQWTSPVGFDYLSAHAFVRDLGPLKSLAVGDYHLTIGQGLFAYTDVARGKAPTIETIKRQNAVISPYTSVNEYRFMRGVAATAELGENIDLTAFASYKKIDNNIERDTLPNEGLIRISIGSIQVGGLHRTESELDNKGQNTQMNVGGDLTYQNQKLKIGVATMYTQFDQAIGLNESRFALPYNYHRFQGDQLLNASIHYSYLIGNINFFGETAYSNDLEDRIGLATVNGAIMSLHPTVDFSVVYRNFQPEYQTILGDPFMESSTPTNENGLFLGVQIKPFKQWTLQAYTDFYKHPWLRSLADAPSYGHEQLVQLTYKPARNLIIYGRFQSKTEGGNMTYSDSNESLTDQDWEDIENNELIDNPISVVALRKNLNWRLDARYTINKVITLKTRLQTSSYEDGILEKKQGYLLYHEIAYQPLSSPFSGNFRYALFDIESSRARIYAYESDILYFFSIPSFNNRGRKFYVNLRYDVSRNITLWARFARTTFDNLDIVGSGNDEIQGNKRTDVKAQLRFKF